MIFDEDKLISNPHSHHGYEKIQDATTMSNTESNKEVISSPTNSWRAPQMSSEIQQVTINSPPLMPSSLEVLPQVSGSTNDSNLLPLITKQSQQTDVHTPILNTNPNQTKKSLNNHHSTHKEKLLDGTELTHIDYSCSHPIKNLLIPLRRSSRLNDKLKTIGHNDAKVIKIGCRNTSYSTNNQHVEHTNSSDIAKSPSSLSPTSTPKKVHTIQDLYDHTKK